MDFRQLRSFVAVAEEMHFGRAAERLHVAPTALSRLVKALEDEIGVRLLTRTTRAVTLTRAGLGFLEDAKAILARTEDAARNARAGRGRRRPDAARRRHRRGLRELSPDAINALRAVLPNVDLRLTETMTAQQLQMLRTGRLDLALIRPPMTASEFPFEILRKERLVALLPEAHPLAARDGLSITDLAGEPIIIPAKRAGPMPMIW